MVMELVIRVSLKATNLETMLCTIHQKNNGHGSIRDDRPDIKIGTNTKVDWNDFSIFREIYDETLQTLYTPDKDNKAMIDIDKLKSELSLTISHRMINHRKMPQHLISLVKRNC